MPADPYTVVEEALRALPDGLRQDVDVVTGTAVRALLAAGYQIIHEDNAEVVVVEEIVATTEVEDATDVIRALIDSGALVQTAWTDHDGAPFYRLAATSEEGGP